MRAAVAAALVTLVSVLAAAPVSAEPILEAADAEDLAATLAEATEVQDVCYGWEVQVDDQGGAGSGIEAGSSGVVGSAQAARACERWAVFTATLTYTSELSESEDGAGFDVASNLTGGPTSNDLRQFGIDENGLLGDNDDVELVNAVSALPALVADAGLAEPIVLEPNAEDLPDGDAATGTPCSDWLRQYGAPLAVAVGLLVLALGWAAYLIVARSALRSRPSPSNDQETAWTP